MNVLVVCNAGVSARAIAAKLEKEIAFHGVAASVGASGLYDSLRRAAGYDALLLGPQVAYAARDAEEAIAESALVYVIPKVDYTRTNAKKIANDVLAALGE